MAARTYSDNITKQRGNISPSQIRANKCQRSKSRNENRQAIKRDAAVLRKADYDSLTVAEKLALLDARLGKNVGAKRQREKLTKLQETA